MHHHSPTAPSHPDQAETSDMPFANGLPPDIASGTLSPEEEISVTELIVLLANLQAERAESTIRSVTRLFPRPDDSPMYQGIATPTLENLAQHIQHAYATARHYRKRLAALRAAHPSVISKTWHQAGGALHAYDCYTWPLMTLLQQLPGDITNAPNLAREERAMCESVRALARQAELIVQDGLEAIGDLMANAAAPAEARHSQDADTQANTQPALGRLLAWLVSHGRFLAQCALEYGDAADHIRERMA